MSIIYCTIFVLIGVLFLSLIIKKGRYYKALFVSKLNQTHEYASLNEKYLDIIYQLQLPKHTESIFTSKKRLTLAECNIIGVAPKDWPSTLSYKVRSLAYMEGVVYASLTGPKQDGPNGAVYAYNDGVWQAISSEKSGPTCPIDNLYVFDKSLYAATYDGVWRYNGTSWKLCNDGLKVDKNYSIYSFTSWNGMLVAGYWGRPDIAILKNQKWEVIAGPSKGWGKNARTIYCMQEFQGKLFVATGTGKLTGQSASIWCYEKNKWQQIAGNGIRGSWLSDGIPFVLSLTVFNDTLLATLSRTQEQNKSSSNVWAFDGVSWCPIGVGSIPLEFADSKIANHAIDFNDNFLIATGDNMHHHIQIWQYLNGEGFCSIGLDSDNIFSNTTDADKGAWIYQMCSDNKKCLYAAVAGHDGAARVLQITFNSV